MTTKAESLNTIKRIADVTYPVAARVYDALIATLIADLKRSGEANLSGIGKLRLVKRDRRSGRNPQTGERIDIPPRIAVTFTASSAITKTLTREG